MKKISLLLFFSLFSIMSFAQKARVKGVILDELKNPVERVTVTALDKITFTNENGFYTIEVPANQKVSLVFSHQSFKKSTISIELKPNEDFELNPVMSAKIEQMGELVITSDSKKRIEGLTTIDPVIIRMIPGANAGIENIIKTLPGVYSNNELMMKI